MAIYGTKYYTYIADASGNTYTVNLKKQNYSSGSTQITDYSTQPLTLQYRGGRDDIDNVIFPSSINLNLYCKSTDDFDDILNSTYRNYQLEVLRTNYASPTYNLIATSGATTLAETGTGASWSLTGSTAYVFLDNSPNESKMLTSYVDSLTDFQIVVSGIYGSGSLTATLRVEFVDTVGTVQETDSATLADKSGTPEDNIYTFTYTGATPITQINLYATIVSLPSFPSTKVSWENTLDIYQGENTSLYWLGWVNPENLTKKYIADQYYLNLEANDGLLDDLQNIEFPSEYSSGQTRMIDIIKAGLGETGLELDITDQLNISEVNSTEPLIKSIYANTRRFVDTDDGRRKYETCYNTLSRLLASFNCQLLQSGGKWTITQKNEVSSRLHSYDYDTLTGSTQSYNREIDVSSYQVLFDSDELSKIGALRTLEITHENRNLSDSVLRNGTFTTNTDGWNNGPASPFYSFSTLGERLLTRDVVGFSDPNTPHEFTSDTFPVTTITTGDTLTVSADIQAVPTWSGTTIDQTYPYVRIDLIYPDTTSVLGTVQRLDGTIKNYEETFDLDQDGNYKIRFWVITDYPTAVNEQLDVYFDNILGIPNYGDITFDRFYSAIVSGSTAVAREEKTIYFGDSSNSGDLGAFYHSTGTGLTSSWSNYAGTVTGATLAKVLAYDILQQRANFKDYLRITLKADSRIGFNNVLNINGKKYSIVGFAHDLRNQYLELDLIEYLTTPISITFSPYTLLTVDGQSSSSGGGGSVTIDGVSEADFDAHVLDNNSAFADVDTRLDTLEANSPITASNGLQKVGNDIRLISSDKGDITVSNSGSTWTIDNSAITTAKIADANVTNSKLANSSINFSLTSTGTDVTLSSSASLGGTATLNIPSASASARGVVTTGTQTFAGAKTFTGQGRFQGWFTSGSGLSLEVGMDGGTGAITAYDRTLSAWAPVKMYSNGRELTISPTDGFLFSGGNVGIGTTTPAHPLDIKSIASTAIQFRGNTLEASNKWSIKLRDIAEGDFGFYDETAGAYRMYFNASGNIGVGTTTPNAPLQFSNSATNQRKIVLYESGNNEHQYYGFGLGPDIFQYRISTTIGNHVWYAGTSSTTSNELMRLTGQGNLGIGTSTPNAPLQFSNSIANRKIVLAESVNNDHQFLGLGYNSDVLRYQVGYTTQSHVWYAGTSSSSSNEIMRLTGDGKLGIGTNNPQFILDVQVSSGDLKNRNLNTGSGEVAIVLDRSGGSYAGGWSMRIPTTSTSLAFHNNAADRVIFDTSGNCTATDWVATSDARLKTNIQPVQENVIEKVLQIGAIVCEYDRIDNGKHETGFIAQQLLKVAPEYVNVPDNPDEMLSVNYSKMTALLFKGFEQLYKQINNK